MSALNNIEEMSNKLSFDKKNYLKMGIDLAQKCIDMGDYKNALKQYEFVQNLGFTAPNSEDELSLKEAIAYLHYKLRDYSVASSLYSEIYEKRRKELGDSHKTVLNLMTQLHLIKCKQGSAVTSLFHFKELLKKQEDLFGPSSRNALLTKCCMIVPLLELKEYQKAVTLCSSLLSEPALNDEEMCQVKNNLALANMHLGDFDESEKIFYQVHGDLKQILGIGHPDTLRPLSRIALVYHLSNKLDLSKKWYQNVWKFQNDVLGSNHPDSLWTAMNYGWLLFTSREHSKHIRVHRHVIKALKASQFSSDKLIEIMIFMSSNILKNAPLEHFVRHISSLWLREESSLIIQEIYDLVKNSNIQKLTDFLGNNFQ